jgi:hypothetical protein
MHRLLIINQYPIRTLNMILKRTLTRDIMNMVGSRLHALLSGLRVVRRARRSVGGRRYRPGNSRPLRENATNSCNEVSYLILHLVTTKSTSTRLRRRRVLMRRGWWVSAWSAPTWTASRLKCGLGGKRGYFCHIMGLAHCSTVSMRAYTRQRRKPSIC